MDGFNGLQTSHSIFYWPNIKAARVRARMLFCSFSAVADLSSVVASLRRFETMSQDCWSTLSLCKEKKINLFAAVDRNEDFIQSVVAAAAAASSASLQIFQWDSFFHID